MSEELHSVTDHVTAVPMKRGVYCEYRGWAVPADEDADDDGFMTERMGSEPNHPDHVGYISWMRADVFERCYGTGAQFGFGRAIAALKDGLPVCRAGWNGKGMFVYLVGAGRYAPATLVGKVIATEQEDQLVPYRPYLAMKTVDGDVVPWVASQTDILADDWGIASVETPKEG